MQAEVYIKARKIFVADKVENTEKCPHCEEYGQTYLLRYFYLSLDEAIYKCGNSKCLYPFHHFVFKNLKDKTVYYYEEVKDETNDIMLKVSMDGQNKYKSANPMRTELFSESQHNPDIESYDFDLFDFVNDNAPALSTSNATITKLNEDFLDFLDEIPSTSANADKTNLDASGVDSFIDNLLNSTPSTSAIVWPNQQNSPPRIEEVKLSKAMDHIEKLKGRKKVKEEKPQETFLQRVRKTKAAQSTNKRKQTATEKVSTLVSTAQNLRPTQFVSQLKSLDLKNSNSSFLRTLAKVKEGSKSGASSSNVEVKDEPINNNILSIAEPTKTVQTKKRCPIQKRKNEFAVKKKESKPRKKPVKRPAKVAATATIVKAEPVDNEPTAIPVVPEENKMIAKSLGSIPINIDLSRISLSKMDSKETNTTIQKNKTPKIPNQRPRTKKTKSELPEPKRVKIEEQLDEGLLNSSTTMNNENDVTFETIAAPVEATITVSQIETELSIEAETPQIEMSNEKTEVELPSNQNDSESDEEDPLTAFSPVTDSDLSKNHLVELKSLKFISNASTIAKIPAKRIYKRRSTIRARKSNTKKKNVKSDTQSESAPSQVSENNTEQRPKTKRATQILNNNNTKISTIKPEEVKINPSPIVIEVSDHSNESNSSQRELITINVEDDTSRHSNETHLSESIVDFDNQSEDFKSKLNVNNRYHRKKFGKIVEKDLSIGELICDWESRSSAESENTNFYPKDLPEDSDWGSTISLDSKTENTEIEE